MEKAVPAAAVAGFSQAGAAAARLTTAGCCTVAASEAAASAAGMGGGRDGDRAGDHQLTGTGGLGGTGSSTTSSSYLVKTAAHIAGAGKAVALGLAPGVAHPVSTVAIGHPFDTVKTRLQTRMHGSSAVDSVRATMSREGFRALYRQCAMPGLARATKRPVEFTVFEASMEH